MKELKLAKIKRLKSDKINEESLKNLFSDIEFKTIVETNMLHSELFCSYELYENIKSDSHRIITINPENSCGRIIEIEDDYIMILIEDNINGKFLREFAESEERNNIYAVMRSLGHKDENDLFVIDRFITFDIVYMKNG